MTTRVRVENMDGGATVRVSTIGKPPGGGPRQAPRAEQETKDLAPGESGEFWVHGSQDLVVAEVVPPDSA